MRIKLKLLVNKQELPIEYRKLILHYIKSSLEGLQGINALDEFYGPDVLSREFTFAVKFYQPKFMKDKILLGNSEIEINLSTSNMKKALIFNNAFTKMLYKSKDIGNENYLLLKDINLYEGKKIVSDEILIKMLSPLCIREHYKGKSDYYYSVANENFKNKSQEIINKQLEKNGISKNIEIEPIEAKKTVVIHYGQKIECSIGIFLLRGNLPSIQEMYDDGIGSRKSAGFGLFQLQ